MATQECTLVTTEIGDFYVNYTSIKLIFKKDYSEFKRERER